MRCVTAALSDGFAVKPGHDAVAMEHPFGRFLPPHPFRRPLLRKRLGSLDVILRRRHRLHGRIFPLLGDRLLQRAGKPRWIACFEARIDIGEFLAIVSAQRSRRRERFARRHHLVDEAELEALLGARRGGR